MVDLPKQYGYLLKQAGDRFYGKDVYALVRKLSHAEILTFIGMEAAERQPCPFHKSSTGRDFTLLNGNVAHGKTVAEYPRYWCMNPDCPHPTGDMLELVHHLNPSCSRHQLAIILLMAKTTGLLRDTDLAVQVGEPADKRGFHARLRRLHKRRREQFPIRKEQSESVSLSSVIDCKPAFARLFREPKGRLCLKKVIDYTPDIRTRDGWLKTALDGMSFVIPNYLTRYAADAKAENVIAREWLVIEGDKRLTLRQQIGVHHQLNGYRQFKLSLLCYSGGKSLRGWYFSHGRSELDCFRLYWHAVYRGMDCACFNICQPVRLPGGWNYKTNKQQTIIEWNI